MHIPAGSCYDLTTLGVPGGTWNDKADSLTM